MFFIELYYLIGSINSQKNPYMIWKGRYNLYHLKYISRLILFLFFIMRIWTIWKLIYVLKLKHGNPGTLYYLFFCFISELFSKFGKQPLKAVLTSSRNVFKVEFKVFDFYLPLSPTIFVRKFSYRFWMRMNLYWRRKSLYY